jgi:hypothetical protein
MTTENTSEALRERVIKIADEILDDPAVATGHGISIERGGAGLGMPLSSYAADVVRSVARHIIGDRWEFTVAESVCGKVFLVMGRQR